MKQKSIAERLIPIQEEMNRLYIEINEQINIMKKPQRSVVSRTAKSNIVKTIKTKKGKWEIYRYTKKKTGKTVIRFGNRLMANNGNNICNNKDFNTQYGSLKNIKAVQATCV